MGQPSIICRWDGEALQPLPSLAKQADTMFVIGEVYPVTFAYERSWKSHKDYFAQIRNAWEGLPEHLMARFPNPDIMRKEALCKKGYCTTRRIVFTSHAAAVRALSELAADYDLALVDDSVLSLFRATSQDYAHMGRKDFEQSKEAVFDQLAEWTGVDPNTYRRNLGMAA